MASPEPNPSTPKRKVSSPVADAGPAETQQKKARKEAEDKVLEDYDESLMEDPIPPLGPQFRLYKTMLKEKEEHEMTEAEKATYAKFQDLEKTMRKLFEELKESFEVSKELSRFLSDLKRQYPDQMRTVWPAPDEPREMCETERETYGRLTNHAKVMRKISKNMCRWTYIVDRKIDVLRDVREVFLQDMWGPVWRDKFDERDFALLDDDEKVEKSETEGDEKEDMETEEMETETMEAQEE